MTIHRQRNTHAQAVFPNGPRSRATILPGLIGWIALALCCVPVTASLAQDATVKDLIFALDESRTPEERQQVLTKIKIRGSQALAIIGNPPQGISQRTQLLLQKVRFEIEQELDARATRPTKFSLSGEFNLKSALKEIESQTGFVFEISKPNNRSKKIKLINIEFWQGLDQLLDLFEADIYQFSKSGKLTIIPANRKSPRQKNSSYAGLLRLEAVQHNSNVSLTGDTPPFDRVWLDIQWEPKLMPYQLVFDHASLVLVDAEENTRKSQLGEKGSLTMTGQEISKQIEMRFDHIPRDIEGIKSISGKLILKAVIGRHAFRFPKITETKPKTQRKSEATVRVLSSQLENSQLKVAMQFEFDKPGDALDSHRGWMFRNQVYLLDEDQKKILPSKTLTTLQEKDKMGFVFTFKIDGQPQQYDFVYESPTSIRELPVEWKLGAISLK